MFDIFNESFVDKVLDMNSRLERIADRLKAIQPKRPGAVTLHLNECGRDHCFGCPHLVWLRWWVRPKPGTDPKDGENSWVSSRTHRPVQSVSDKRVFFPHRDEVVDLIREALALEKKRSGLLKAAANFRRTVKLTKMPQPIPPGGKKKLRKTRKQKIDSNDPFTWI